MTEIVRFYPHFRTGSDAFGWGLYFAGKKVSTRTSAREVTGVELWEIPAERMFLPALPHGK